MYDALSNEPQLKDIVPRYLREVEFKNEKYIELQDLLHTFRDPYVMDIKMGTRTFLESEVQNTFAREDLYLKVDWRISILIARGVAVKVHPNLKHILSQMIAVDPSAPTSEENEARKVTKLRYMQFREEQSSTSTLGFRIEAMKVCIFDFCFVGVGIYDIFSKDFVHFENKNTKGISKVLHHSAALRMW